MTTTTLISGKTSSKTQISYFLWYLTSLNHKKNKTIALRLNIEVFRQKLGVTKCCPQTFQVCFWPHMFPLPFPTNSLLCNFQIRIFETYAKLKNIFLTSLGGVWN